MITLELTEKEADAFRSFREHQDTFSVMLKAGVFEMRRGSVEIHFDPEGKVGAIIGHPLMYKRDQLVVMPA